jgi:AcrR family transcriptional regulator
MATSRDRELTEQRLIETVGRLLARSGFAALGVNALAREAGVDKVLIYRYFDGLPNLLKAYCERGDFWPTAEEVLQPDVATLRAAPIAARTAAIVVNLLDALRRRPQTMEILAWEVVERNALTDTLAAIRERWSRDVTELVLPDAAEDPSDFVALANLLVAGIQYLLIRSRTTPVYGGIPLRTDEGWERIRKAAIMAFGVAAPAAEPVTRRTPGRRTARHRSETRK